MPKTSERLSTDNAFDVISDQTSPPSRPKKTFRSITDEHILQAFTAYLTSMRMIDTNEEVTSYHKTPQGIDVKIGVFK